MCALAVRINVDYLSVGMQRSGTNIPTLCLQFGNGLCWWIEHVGLVPLVRHSKRHDIDYILISRPLSTLIASGSVRAAHGRYLALVWRYQIICWPITIVRLSRITAVTVVSNKYFTILLTITNRNTTLRAYSSSKNAFFGIDILWPTGCVRWPSLLVRWTLFKSRSLPCFPLYSSVSMNV